MEAARVLGPQHSTRRPSGERQFSLQQQSEQQYTQPVHHPPHTHGQQAGNFHPQSKGQREFGPQQAGHFQEDGQKGLASQKFPRNYPVQGVHHPDVGSLQSQQSPSAEHHPSAAPSAAPSALLVDEQQSEPDLDGSSESDFPKHKRLAAQVILEQTQEVREEMLEGPSALSVDEQQSEPDLDGSSESDFPKHQRVTAQVILEKTQEVKEEMLEGMARTQNEGDLKEEQMEMIVRRVERANAKKNVAKVKIQDAFEISVEDMRKLGSRSRKRSLCQLMFCFVIMGCELDMVGFVGAFPGYWNLEITIVRALLVAMPSAFLLCITLYFAKIQPEEDEMAKKTLQENGSGNTMAQRAKALLRRKNVCLSWYHFLPLARYILLIKSTTGEDVEGIFRVNTLSSFTLGSCQIVGLLFTIMVNGNSFAGLSIFVYMNMFSQLVNWSITFLYFATPIATRMKNSIASSAYSANLSAQMRKTLVQLQICITEDAKRLAELEINIVEGMSSDGASDGYSSDDEDGCLTLMRAKLENEIYFFKMTAVELRYFDPIELLTIRRAVYMQFAEEFDQ